MVDEVKGELVKVQYISMGEKIDNSAVLKSRQDYCAELSSAGPCGMGSKVCSAETEQLRGCKNEFKDKAEQWLAQQSVLELTFGSFHEHSLEWYHKYAVDKTLKLKFLHVRQAVKIFKECRFHPGQTVSDRMLYLIEEAAQKKAGSSSGMVEGELNIRYLPILEVLQFITEMLLKIEFKEGIFSLVNVPVNEEAEAQMVKDTFVFMQAFKDQFPVFKCGWKGQRLCRMPNKKDLGVFWKHGKIMYYNQKDNQKWVMSVASGILNMYLGMQIARSDTGYHIEGLHRGQYWPCRIFGKICPGCGKQCRNSCNVKACMLKCDFAEWDRLTPIWGTLWNNEFLK